jgi:hypothetical protein
VAKCREIVRSMVGADGMMSRTRRDELAGLLRGAGMAEQDVRYVLEHIPGPPGETSEPHDSAEPGETGEAEAAAGIASAVRAASAAAAVEQEPSAPLLGQGVAQPRRLGGLLVAGVVLGMSVLVTAALWSQFSRRLSRGAGGNALVAGTSRAGGNEANGVAPPAPSAASRPVVLDAAIAALATPAKARSLLDNAGSEDRTAAFDAVAGIMVLGGTPRETVSAETLLKVVLGCPPASPACQDAAVTALIDRRPWDA